GRSAEGKHEQEGEEAAMHESPFRAGEGRWGAGQRVRAGAATGSWLCPAGGGVSRAGRRRSRRRSSWALSATTMVDALMRMAPTSGDSVIPNGAPTPAARGMANRL